VAPGGFLLVLVVPILGGVLGHRLAPAPPGADDG
jgi:hypothetical protein